MPARCSVMLCVVGGSIDSGVGVRAIYMLSSSSCSCRLSAQQLGVSSMGEVEGLPWNLLLCGCLCLCGLISIPAAILVASVDCSWALWITANCGVVMMSVGHLNPSPAIFLVTVYVEVYISYGDFICNLVQAVVS